VIFRLALTLVIAFANMAGASAADARPDNSPECVFRAAHTGFLGSQALSVSGVCTSAADSGSAGPPTKVIRCGQPSSRENGFWNRQCGAPRLCLFKDKKTGRPVHTDAFATLTRTHGRWGNPQVWCPANPGPQLDLTALRDHAIRLLPKISIGAAWSHFALVNAESLFWADTGPQRILPPVTVLGRRVALRVHFVRANWRFGDGTSDEAPTLGKPYDAANDPCNTAQCPHYYGHTYRQTGTVIIALTITWRAQYSLDRKHWEDISGDITGPATHHRLPVKQARGVLVPNPGEH
jgi:hypothetical protein